MEWPLSIKVFAGIIAAFTAVLVVAAVKVARARGPSSVAIVLLVAAAAPVVCGVLGMIGGFFTSMEHVEALRAPTPRDLAAGVRNSGLVFVLGLAGSAVSGVAALVALLRARRDDEPPPLE